MKSQDEPLFRLVGVVIGATCASFFLELTRNHSDWFGVQPRSIQFIILLSLAAAILLFAGLLSYFIRHGAEQPTIRSMIVMTLIAIFFSYIWYIGKMAIFYYL